MSQDISTTTSKLKLNGTVINKCWPVRRAMVVVIILLHALITINFAANWSQTHSSFIKNGQNFWTICLGLNNGHVASWEMGIPASMSSIITDFFMVCMAPQRIIHISSSLFQLKIWYCWMVWGRRWLVVLPPIPFLISATGKVFDLIYSLGISNLICSGEDHCSILSVLLHQCTRSCNILNALHTLSSGDDTMVHAAHHLPNFDGCRS